MIKTEFSINKLPLTIMKQGKSFIAYTPALDISTSGKSLKDVQKKFIELVHIFIEELIRGPELYTKYCRNWVGRR